MPQGDKGSYTSKQKRQAEHIEDSEKRRGRSTKTAERIAWATVNKQDGGGKKSGRGRAKGRTAKGRGRSASTRSGRRPARKSARSRSTRSRTVRARA